jgi:hypothetical protein
MTKQFTTLTGQTLLTFNTKHHDKHRSMQGYTR